MTGAIPLLIGSASVQARHRLAGAWRGNKSQLVIILGFLSLFFVGATVLFHLLFDYVSELSITPDARDVVLSSMLPMLFFCLFLMLTFSGGVMSWISFFRGGELDNIMAWPVPPKEAFVVRFLESFVFSAWAFFFLIGPLMAGYAATVEVSGWFLPVGILAAGCFALCSAAFGTLVSVITARWLVRWRRPLLWIALGTLVFLGLGLWAEMRELKSSGYAVYAWAQSFRDQFSFVETSLLPPFWMHEAFRAAAAGNLGRASYIVGLLAANALFLLHLSGCLLAPAWLSCKDNLVRSRRMLSEGWSTRLFGPRSSAGVRRLLLWKDLKLFIRDPAQWLQLIIFFGILGIYFYNLHRHDNTFGNSQLMGGLITSKHVGFVNLTATLLTLGTFTTRFVFPQLSLEGRRFWILGQLPIDRRRVLVSKFQFSLLGSLVIALSLTWISATRLELAGIKIAIQMLVALSACVGLCGISCGFGILFPDFRATSATRVVSGFGGTLNLVAGALFLALVVGCAAPAFWNAETPRDLLDPLNGLGLLLSLGIGLLAAWLPMKWGGHRIETLDF